ncbi:hypothetical protein QQ045_007561 [Rhodiola kirilowii]
MGAACCVAAKSKSELDGPNWLDSQMNNRCSPSWNFRWDNRGRVAGEETAVRWFADMSSRDSQLGNISETEVRTISEVGSPENFQPLASNRSSLPEEDSVLSVHHESHNFEKYIVHEASPVYRKTDQE